MARRLPGTVPAAHIVLRGIVDRRAVASRVCEKIERHIKGQCWGCGGYHLAATCRKAFGLRCRECGSGALKRKDGTGGGKKGKYKSGSRKRKQGVGGGEKGAYKSGCAKRKGGKGGGPKMSKVMKRMKVMQAGRQRPKQ